MNQNSKIFLAGHNGLVGSALMAALRSTGYNKIITCAHRELDLTDQTQTNKFFAREKPEYVFLSAALVGGIMEHVSRQAELLYQNSMIAANVIHSAHKYGVKKLVYISSTSIYPQNVQPPTCEEHLWQGELEYTIKPYAIAKLFGASLCEYYNIQYKTNFITIVPTNLYGNNDKFDLRTAHVLPAMLRKFHLAKLLEKNDINAICADLKILNGDEAITELKHYGIEKGKISIWGTGNAKREFLHSSDLASACLFVMKNIDFIDLIEDMDKIKNTQINVSYGQNISIKDLANTIKEIVGFKGEICFDSTKLEGMKERLTSSKKLQSFGWNPKIALNDGIESLYQWYINRPQIIRSF